MNYVNAKATINLQKRMNNFADLSVTINLINHFCIKENQGVLLSLCANFKRIIDEGLKKN